MLSKVITDQVQESYNVRERSSLSCKREHAIFTQWMATTVFCILDTEIFDPLGSPTRKLLELLNVSHTNETQGPCTYMTVQRPFPLVPPFDLHVYGLPLPCLRIHTTASIVP